MKEVTIIDYGMGNLGSISNMLRVLGFNPIISHDTNVIQNSKYLILPGVGKFDAAVKNLKERNLFDLLKKLSKINDIHILGICLGMQLMCRKSEEGILEGLGIFNAEVKDFSLNIDSTFKIPHMGWNFVKKRNDLDFLKNLENPRFYFVHSYFVESQNKEDILFKSDYGIEFISGMQNNNNIGVQFHPEKSHKFGKEFFRSFLAD